MAEKLENHMNHHVSHRRGIATYVGIVVIAVLLFSIGAMYGAHLQDKMTADNGPKPTALPPQAKDTNDTTLADASKLATDGKFDDAIAKLTPYAKDTSKLNADRVNAALSIGNYEQQKKDLPTALTWFNYAKSISSSPSLPAFISAGTVSSQVYASKLAVGTTTAPDAATVQLKTDAVTDLTQAIGMTTDATVKSNLQKELAAIKQLP